MPSGSRSVLRSKRWRAFVSLLLTVAAGLSLVFPVQHGCQTTAFGAQSATAPAAPTSMAGMAGHGSHSRHQPPTAPYSADCSCIGDVCGPSFAVPLMAPSLNATALAFIDVSPVYAAAEPFAAGRTHVLPFANGPPALQHA